jgi:hypothetical protein
MNKTLEVLKKVNAELSYQLAKSNSELEEANDIAMGYKKQINEANKIVETWCKDCRQDNFGICANNCSINDLKKCLSQEQTIVGEKKNE